MVLDLAEVEGNLEKLAFEIKDQDYDFMEVLEENEEIENQYEELAQEYQRLEAVIAGQRQLIETL